MKKTLLLLSLTLITFFSCTNVSEDDLTTNQPQPVLTTYQDIKVIIDNNCLNCHQSPPVNGANTPLLIYNNVKDRVLNNNLIGRISAQAGSAGAMPFGGPKLPQNLIDQIIKWETDGLLEN